MRKQLLSLLLACFALTLHAQCKYDYSRMQREHLGRGLVCVREGDYTVISWRLHKGEEADIAFNVYQNNKLLNKRPLTDATFIKTKSLKKDAVYELRTVRNGKETGDKESVFYNLPKKNKKNYLSIPLRVPEDGMTPDGHRYSYSANDASVGDVDGDGKDEITYGSMCVDHDGTGLYSTGFGHGDAMHQMAFYPGNDALQIWDVHENKRDGSDFRDARTGKVIFQIPSGDDVGRGMAADIDPNNYGLEMWSASQKGFYDVKGNLHVTEKWIPQNSAVWWDGDKLRELLDRESVQKYDWNSGTCKRIIDFKADGCAFNNGTKQNPCLSADLFGDWREEVIVRTNDSHELRIYTTTIPTQYRFPTFMEDIPYRISVATENVAYNQPPEPGFYFGSDK